MSLLPRLLGNPLNGLNDPRLEKIDWNAAVQFTTCTNPIIHLFPPKKICIGIVFDFSWDISCPRRNCKQWLWKSFFFGGGGGGNRGVLWDCASSECHPNQSPLFLSNTYHRQPNAHGAFSFTKIFHRSILSWVPVLPRQVTQNCDKRNFPRALQYHIDFTRLNHWRPLFF